MTAEWVTALVAITGMLATGGGVIWRAGRHDGKVTAAIEQLTKIVADHEDRIRAGEKRQKSRRR